MGNRTSKIKNTENLHIVTYNATASSTLYNNNIIINFINNFNEKNSILTLQGIVNDDIINDLNDIYNIYYSNKLNLLILTNLDIKYKKEEYYNNTYHNLDSNIYGYQTIDIKFNDVEFSIYNTELIPDSVEEINNNPIREKQMYELISFICKNLNKKIHLVTGCFYDNDIKELINLSNIKDIITNLKTGAQNNYIFIYSDKLINNLDELNEYLKKEFNLYVIRHKIYNLGINEHCPFETILAIENLKN